MSAGRGAGCAVVARVNSASRPCERTLAIRAMHTTLASHVPCLGRRIRGQARLCLCHVVWPDWRVDAGNVRSGSALACPSAYAPLVEHAVNFVTLGIIGFALACHLPSLDAGSFHV